jgi:hypothetical protein
MPAVVASSLSDWAQGRRRPLRDAQLASTASFIVAALPSAVVPPPASPDV